MKNKRLGISSALFAYTLLPILYCLYFMGYTWSFLGIITHCPTISHTLLSSYMVARYHSLRYYHSKRLAQYVINSYKSN